MSILRIIASVVNDDQDKAIEIVEKLESRGWHITAATIGKDDSINRLEEHSDNILRNLKLEYPSNCDHICAISIERAAKKGVMEGILHNLVNSKQGIPPIDRRGIPPIDRRGIK